MAAKLTKFATAAPLYLWVSNASSRKFFSVMSSARLFPRLLRCTCNDEQGYEAEALFLPGYRM